MVLAFVSTSYGHCDRKVIPRQLVVALSFGAPSSSEHFSEYRAKVSARRGRATKEHAAATLVRTLYMD